MRRKPTVKVNCRWWNGPLILQYYSHTVCFMLVWYCILSLCYRILSVLARSLPITVDSDSFPGISMHVWAVPYFAALNQVKRNVLIQIPVPSIIQLTAQFIGVTSVGVTWGGNWRCHLFFPLKNWRPFLVIVLCEVMTFILAVVSSPHHSHLPTSFVQCSF